MKKKIFLSIVFLLTFLSIRSQSFLLQGKVLDDKENPIEFASVSVLKQGKATLTSLKGTFSLRLQSQDSVIVKFSMIGYKSKTKILHKPSGKQTLVVTLHSSSETLEGITVTEMKRQTGQTQELNKESAKLAPTTSGNAVEELIQSQAGVSSHNELSSQYNVRGGNFDENCVYINGIEVYRPFLIRSGQQEGLSVINPDMVENIKFSSGGFEAKYGDKMSSVLDISYKQPKHFEASLFGSMLGGNAYVGIKKKKFFWTNGLRYKTNKYLLGSLETKGEYHPRFFDYQTYISFNASEKLKFDFIGNISNNNYRFQPSDRETKFGTLENVKSFKVYFDGQEKDLFKTLFGNFKTTYIFNKNTNISLLLSAFHTNEEETYDIQGQYWLTQTETSENLGVGTYFEHARNYLKADVKSVKLVYTKKYEKHLIESGFTFKHENIRENSSEYEMRDSSGYSIPHTGKDLNLIYSLKAKNELINNRFEAYLQDSYKFSSHGKANEGENEKKNLYTLNYGIRVAHWNFNQETIVSPRISFSLIPAFNQNLTLRIASGIYYQSPFFKELRDTLNQDGTTYTYLNKKIRSQRSIHFIGGCDYRFNISNRPYKFTTEIYYKALSNLIPYTVNNVKVVYYGDRKCSGHTAGIDMKLYGEFVPGTDSWISFSFMNTKMDLNEKKIPLPTDQRYAINLFFTDYFPGTTRWKMSLKLAYADGLPFYTPHREFEYSPFRAPAYKRADIGMSYNLINNEKNPNKLIKSTWIGIDCLNILGIHNVNSYYWITDVTNNQYAIPNYLTGRQINLRFLINL